MAIDWKVVGHRGYAACYPENTAVGFEAALNVGVEAIELDVQCSGDGVPVVIHDETLDRTTNEQGRLGARPFSELAQVSCHYPEKFGDTFFPLPLQSLEQTSVLLSQYREYVFIEIKKESLAQRSRASFLKSVLQASQLLGKRRYIISFDAEILQLAKTSTDLPIGWCIDDFSEQTLRRAKALSPHMLICSRDMPADGVLWPGTWQWFVYGVETQAEAAYWAERGAQWIEADDPQAVKSEYALQK